MATCSKLPLLFVLAAAATIHAAAAQDPPFQQVTDVDSPFIQQLGAWAVEQHVKQANDGLRFLKVLDAQFQYVLGRVNFVLVIDTVNDVDGPENHTAKLYDDGWSNWLQLVSFN